MTKKATVNTFDNGVNSDLDESRVSNKVLTAAHNITLNARDKQLTLQKENGLEYMLKDNIPDYPTNLTPLAVKELEDVAYIVSVDDDGKTEYGTYPSPDFDTMLIANGTSVLNLAAQPDLNISMLANPIKPYELDEPSAPDNEVTVVNNSDIFTIKVRIHTDSTTKLGDSTDPAQLYIAQTIAPSASATFYYKASYWLDNNESIQLQAVVESKTSSSGSVVFDEPYALQKITVENQRLFAPSIIVNAAVSTDYGDDAGPGVEQYTINPHHGISPSPEVSMVINSKEDSVTTGGLCNQSVDLDADKNLVVRVFDIKGNQIASWYKNWRHCKTGEHGWTYGTCYHTWDLLNYDRFKQDVFYYHLQAGDITVSLRAKTVLHDRVAKNTVVWSGFYAHIAQNFYAPGRIGGVLLTSEDDSHSGFTFDSENQAKFPHSDNMLPLNNAAVPTIKTYVATLTNALEPKTFIPNVFLLSSADNNKIIVDRGMLFLGEHPLSHGSNEFVLKNTSNVAVSEFLVTATSGDVSVWGLPLQMYDYKNTYNLVERYSALRNFSTSFEPLAQQYSDEFRTQLFKYTVDSALNLELQKTYDGTINMITTDGLSAPRIVNSRTLFHNNNVELVIRDNNSLSNVYCDSSIDTTRLIPFIGNNIPTLEFLGVKQNSGILFGGGYKYFFKLLTDDDAETDVIEESRLVSIHIGNEFGNSFSILDGKASTNAVAFKLSKLVNKAFKSCAVYFTVTNGSTDSTSTTAYRIDKPYSIEASTGICEILHTGHESVTVINAADLQVGYSQINTVKTLAQKNNRLLLGNTSVKNTRDVKLQEAALMCYPITSEARFIKDGADFRVTQSYNDSVEDDSYANPINIYEYLGYIPGESYEIAVNFIFDSGAISEAYPIQGLDFKRATAVDQDLLGIYTPEFVPNTGQNARGVVRTKQTSLVSEGGKNMVDVATIEIDTSKLFTSSIKSTLVDLDVIGFFLSRRERIKDMLMEGLLTAAVSIPTQTNSKTSYSWINTGFQLGCTLPNVKTVVIPAPCHTMEYSSEGTDGDEAMADFKSICPIAGWEDSKHYAFYSPDIQMNTAAAAAMFNDATDFGLQTDVAVGTPHDKIVSTSTAAGYNTNFIPYLYRVADNPGENVGAEVLINKVEAPVLSFVDDSFRSHAHDSFSGRSDRQIGFTPIFNTAIGTEELDIEDGSHDTESVTSWKADSSETVKARWKAAKSNLRFSPYIGVTTKEPDTNLNGFLGFSTDEDAVLGYNNAFDNSGYPNSPGSIERIEQILSGMKLGVFSRIYSTKHGDMLTEKNWEARYSNTASGDYNSITPRFELNGSTISRVKLQGGDSYSGFYYQQVWRPGGVNGIPTASSPIDYSDDRQGTGLTDSGLTIAFPVRSSTNFALRGHESGEIIEDKLEVANRKYMHHDVTKSTSGNRRREPATSNYGNFKDKSLTTRTKYDQSTPYTVTKQDNRVYVSDSNITSEFKNGYRIFKGYNFQNYDSELGDITAIVSSGLYTYIVYKNGVSYIEVAERAAMSTPGDNSVYIGNANVLAEKTTTVMPFIGSQHLRSVIATEIGVFGVDADRKRIWQLNGTTPDIVSENRVQKIIDPWFEGATTIISSYKQVEKEVAFTFQGASTPDRTIIYNVKFKLWYGTSDIHHVFQFLIKDQQLALKPISDSASYGLYMQTKDLYTYQTGAPDNIELLDSYFEFVVKAESLNTFDITNLVINGYGVPKSVEIESSTTLNYEFGRLGAVDEIILYEDVTPIGTGMIILDNKTLKSFVGTTPVLKIGDNIKFVVSVTGQTVYNTIINIQAGTSSEALYTLATTLPVSSGNITSLKVKSIDSVDISNIACHTNIYMPVTTSGLTIIDHFNIQVDSPNKSFKVNDLITLMMDGKAVQTTVAKITVGANVIVTIGNKININSTFSSIYYGWKVPLRLSLMDRTKSETKITVPSKYTADMIAGNTIDKSLSIIEGYNSAPSGQWIKVRLNFNGIEPMYISSINSLLNLTYS